jgi:rubrerythrin
MLDVGVEAGSFDGHFVELFEAGLAAKGQFHCAECGYGVTVQSRLPVCPMCAGSTWEQSPWSPLSRSTAWTL